MEQRLSMVTLGVADLGRARAFYEALGWRAKWANDSVAFFEAGGTVLALHPRADLAADAGVAPGDADAFAGMTLAHNVREKREVVPTLNALVAAGGRMIKPAQEVSWGGFHGYVADPDGCLWEIAWNPHFPLDEAGRVRLPDDPNRTG